VKRREFIALAGGAAVAWSLAARPQQKSMPVIGFLSNATSDAFAPAVAGFRQGLAQTGYVEAQSVAIEYRWAEGRYNRLPALAADLVGRKVEVIAAGSTNAIQAAKSATSMIPIVIIGGGDPRFATREEAEANARDLMMRWFAAVLETRLVESDDPVNNLTPTAGSKASGRKKPSQININPARLCVWRGFAF
jgi:hypothetical protein